MNKTIHLILLLLIEISFCSSTPESEFELKNFLISRNNSNVLLRPVPQWNQPVVVEVAFYIQKVNELVEKTKTFIVTGYLGVIWTNQHFRWNNSADFYKIKQFLLPAKQVWLPDIGLTNS